MSQLRDHQPITIDQFNGLWQRGDATQTPLDHFQDCNNLRFTGENTFGTRYGIGISQDVSLPLSNIKRIYNFPTQNGNTLIILAYNYSTNQGSIYHFVNSNTLYGPLLTITGMTDFAFVPFFGRAYISPFSDFALGELTIQKGLQNEFLYVYRGDGTAATKAAGANLAGSMTIADGAAGHTDAGVHIFGFVSETDTGYLSPPAFLASFTTSSTSSVSFGSVPTSGDSHVVKRLLVASKKIDNYNGDVNGYQLFFVSGAEIDNNTDTFLNNISFFDGDLLDDASYLVDNYSEIPAGAVLTSYHDRLILGARFDDVSTYLVSKDGEPESISQIDGLMTIPPDGNPITNGIEYRDVFYGFKRARTVAFQDNGDAPSSWPLIVVDTALGTCVHGIATVLDSGGASIDFLILATFQGISVFNGRFITPELSWKVESYWKNLDRNSFGKIQIINAPVQKELYCVLPTNNLLVGNYSRGMDAKKIRWSPESYLMAINTIAIWNIDEIIVGADLNF